MKGYVHVYTGNGKGKTTAAIGLALRAAGAGRKVIFAQFVKGKPYNENKIIRDKIDNIVVKQYGMGCFILGDPSEDDFKAATDGLADVRKIINENKYDVIILDEINIALYYNLIDLNELIGILEERPENQEIIITGRYAPRQLMEFADLVTEMKEIKHYYNKGIEAREGIEF